MPGIYRQVEQLQNFPSFDPAKDQIPNGVTLLGVILSSDKTNISVMTGNRMAHPLLISLTNINPDIHSKGSLHAYVLLALLPVVSFLHPKTCIRSLLSNCLIHESINFVVKPLKSAASIGIMMSDPIGSLHYCFTPLVAYIANTPEQTLLACISPKASPISTATHKEFGESQLYPLQTATKTLGNIEHACSEADPDDWESFLKVARCYYLNGVHRPFWRNWALCDPLIFFNPEVLHHFHHLFWDHDLQWCLVVVGPNEIDFQISLIQVAVGYHSFKEGISKLKQVTGCGHCTVQRYIIGVIAGAIPPKFLVAIRALFDFHYLTQMPRFDDKVLDRIEASLHTFHENKSAIISAGGRQGSNGPLDHWEIPKLELLQHIVPSIRTSGAVMQWSADVTEHAHVTEIKQPARSGNNEDYYAQIARHLNHSDKCFHFDLATRIASTEQEAEEDEDQEDDHEPDSEVLHATYYHSPTHASVNFFEVAEGIASHSIPNSVCPPRIFASLTTAFCLAVKPSSCISVVEASKTFGLPDLR